MANLPSQSQLQESNSSRPNSPDPNSNHGIHIPCSPPSMSDQSPGPLDATVQDAGGSSREVSEVGTPNGWNHLPHRSCEPHSRSHSDSVGVGSTQPRGRMPGTTVSLGSQQSTGSVSSRGSVTHSARKRARKINSNHLLNFQYSPTNLQEGSGT